MLPSGIREMSFILRAINFVNPLATFLKGMYFFIILIRMFIVVENNIFLITVTLNQAKP